MRVVSASLCACVGVPTGQVERTGLWGKVGDRPTLLPRRRRGEYRWTRRGQQQKIAHKKNTGNDQRMSVARLTFAFEFGRAANKCPP